MISRSSLWRSVIKPPFLHERAWLTSDFSPQTQLVGNRSRFRTQRASQNCCLLRSYPHSFRGKVVSPSLRHRIPYVCVFLRLFYVSAILSLHFRSSKNTSTIFDVKYNFAWTVKTIVWTLSIENSDTSGPISKTFYNRSRYLGLSRDWKELVPLSESLTYPKYFRSNEVQGDQGKQSNLAKLSNLTKVPFIQGPT